MSTADLEPMSTADLETVLYDVADGIAVITLNRPEKLNAWNAQLSAELGEAMATADADDAVRAVVVTGAGRAFCAGADLSAGHFRGGDSATLRECWPNDVRKPVIAAINGHAVGVGITYPMLCDVRFVAEDAKVAFAFVRRGALPELGSHAVLPRVIGLSGAAELLLSGKTISGREAAARGLASKALPRDEVLPAALELARDIAANTAPVSVAIAKQLLWDGITRSVSDMRSIEGPLFAKLTAMPDASEGVTAFLEKRAPQWSGKVSSDLPQ